MLRNPVWIAFIVFVGAATTYFTGVAIKESLYYSALKSETPAHVTKWSTAKVGTDYYAPLVYYTFSHDGQEYESQQHLSYRTSRNEFGTQEMIKELSQREWTVHYDPTDPNHSTIDKRIPLSAIISAALMALIFFYFIWLGSYIAKKTSEN